MSIRGRGPASAVLITGVGGQLGMSLLKALRQSELQPYIVGTDARPISVGLYCVDSAYTMPDIKIDASEYISRLMHICRTEGVRMICFGSETELERVAPHADLIEAECGARAVVLKPDTLLRMIDKWWMVQHLRSIPGLPYPDTALADDETATQALVGRHGFPLVLKPRRGAGAQNVFVLNGDLEVKSVGQLIPNAILQEYLLPDREEYTVGTYTSVRTGYVGEIIMRRVLDSGGTYKAEVVEDDEIATVCRQAVAGRDVWGPVNIQLRKTPQGVRIFEMNPRFSGSVPIRAHFGFNELEMALFDIVLNQDVPRPTIRKGYALRFWEELYLEPRQYPSGGASTFVYPRLGTDIGRGLTGHRGGSA